MHGILDTSGLVYNQIGLGKMYEESGSRKNGRREMAGPDKLSLMRLR